jgi:hypothetical protein
MATPHHLGHERAAKLDERRGETSEQGYVHALAIGLPVRAQDGGMGRTVRDNGSRSPARRANPLLPPGIVRNMACPTTAKHPKKPPHPFIPSGKGKTSTPFFRPSPQMPSPFLHFKKSSTPHHRITLNHQNGNGGERVESKAQKKGSGDAYFIYARLCPF